MGQKLSCILDHGNIHFKILPHKLGLGGLILAGALATIAQPANDNFANRAAIVSPGTNATIFRHAIECNVRGWRAFFSKEFPAVRLPGGPGLHRRTAS